MIEELPRFLCGMIIPTRCEKNREHKRLGHRRESPLCKAIDQGTLNSRTRELDKARKETEGGKGNDGY